MQCYSNYETLQLIRESIDNKLTTKNSEQEALLKFRGQGAPNDGDIIYGSIYESDLENETIVGLQSKLLFLLNVLQNTDAKPTTKTQEASGILNMRVTEMTGIWNSITN
jgi:hypothetical protein